MDRRTFLGWISLGVIASSLPVAIAASTEAKEELSGDNSIPLNTTSSVSTSTTEETTIMAQNSSFFTVGSVTQLNSKGQIFQEKTPIGSVLVVRSDNNLVAVNPTCPHKGCRVKWQSQEQNFDCPCHEGKFHFDGSVKGGKPKRPLKVYTVKIVGDSVLVKT